MYRIGKKFMFEASHWLNGLPGGHQCGRLHGHSYVVELTFVGSGLSEEGWLFDFGDLNQFKQWVDKALDHRHLNDIIAQPTSENLASYIAVQFNTWSLPSGTYLEKVRVQETEKTFAEYYPAIPQIKD